MSSRTSTGPSTRPWTNWPPHAKRKLLARLQHERWLAKARTEPRYPCGCGLSHSQLEPEGKWRAWYLQGGRGAGKTRTGAETLAEWIRRYCLTPEMGDWAVIAPTFGDARDTCIEGVSGLLPALRGLVSPDAWNRSQGQLFLPNGSRVYCDGANDGAERIQGKNLRGVWADEVGLWQKWEQAWHFSIAHALRLEPGRIVATGTPKMGHPLVAYLIDHAGIPVHHMRMVDNEENLSQAAIEDLLAEYPEGSTVRRQELEGHFIEALEGSLLSRHDWRFFRAGWEVVDGIGRLDDASARAVESDGKFDRVVCSWDTTWKAKAASDFVAGQAWGCHGADRVLLAVFHERSTLDEAIEGMLAMRAWTGKHWPDAKQEIIIENATWGPEAYDATRRRVQGVHKLTSRGDKGARAFTASPALETGHCKLPGVKDDDPDGRGYVVGSTPAMVQSFVEECAEFDPATMRHRHDDQVDAWSQMVNWTRRDVRRPTSFARPSGRVLRPGSLARP